MTALNTDTVTFAVIYAAAVSLIGVALTVYDKIASKHTRGGRGRIPENTLMYLALLGGAAPMYCVMRIIRHKTRHKKFMVGLPIFAVIHAVIIVAVIIIR